MNAAASRLTLGPLLFHWPARKRRDFYLRMADESPVDVVYLGEVVCSKREGEFRSLLGPVAERLRAAGKQIVYSTLALVTTAQELEAIRERAGEAALIEANDVATLQLLGEQPHVVGPYINVFNEGSRNFLIGRGAIRIVLPVELSITAIGHIATPALGTEFEVQVFGRQPLSVAMRCYHARSHNLTKDHCQLVCGLDADGLTTTTLDGADVLVVNGTQTLSYGNGVLLPDLPALRAAGVQCFRLSPQDLDMVAVSRLYRDVLDGSLAADEGLARLRALTGSLPYINGFARGGAGRLWQEA